MGITRPNIAFTVLAVSYHYQSSSNPHCKAAKTILAYLARIPDHGICFSANESMNHLVGYSDADYTGFKIFMQVIYSLVFYFYTIIKRLSLQNVDRNQSHKIS